MVYDTTNDIRADLRIGVINGMGRDRVTNVSAITTGTGNDVLIGTDRHDDFLSNAGDDTLIGLRGNDLSGPGTGDDVVRGGRGGDPDRLAARTWRRAQEPVGRLPVGIGAGVFLRGVPAGPQSFMTGQVSVRVTPSTAWILARTSLPRSSISAASARAMTS